jgi:hypothetical protein
VNDDLDAFTGIPQKLGARARQKENIVFWKMITANAAMADGVALFHANHGNLGSAAAIGETPISAARTAMTLQTDLDGELTRVAPKYLVVPAAKQTAAEKFLMSIQPTATADVNVFSNKLVPVVEPLLDANSSIAYYLMADKAMIDIAEMALLDGKGPEIFTREGFDVDGMELKVRYVFGMKILDWRGLYKQPGA